MRAIRVSCRGFPALLCLLVCLGTAIPARGGPRVFSASKGPLEIMAQPDSTALELPILNRSRSARVVRVRLVVPSDLAEAIRTVTTVRLEPTSLTEVEFPAAGDELPLGTFEGEVVVGSARRGRPDRRTIEVVVAPLEAAEGPTLAAAVDEMTLIAHRDGPWDDDVDVTCEPALVAGCLPFASPPWGDEILQERVPAHEPLAVLAGSGARLVAVEWSGETSTLLGADGGLVGLELDVHGDARPDTYKGDIDLLPDDPDNESVSVTLIVTDRWGWALGMLILGLVVAALVRHWQGAGAKLSKLRQDANEAYEAFRCDEPGASGTATSYDIAAEAESFRQRVETQVAELTAWWNLELSDEDPGFKAGLDNLQTLQDQARSWCAFLGELEMLRTSLKQLPVAGEDPRWLETALDLADPAEKTPLTFEVLDELRSRLRNTLLLARAWKSLTGRLSALDQAIGWMREYLPTLDEAQLAAFREGEMRASEVRWELWHAEDADEVIRRGVMDDLTEAERQIARLRDLLPEAGVATDEKRTVQLFRASSKATELRIDWRGPSTFTPKALSPTQIIRRERVRRRIFNRAVILILLAGLLYAGMSELYFDEQVYGTAADYLATFAWGLGSLFTLDALSSAIDKFKAVRA